MFAIFKKTKPIVISYSSYFAFQQSRAAMYSRKAAAYGLLAFIQELTVPEKTFCMT